MQARPSRGAQHPWMGLLDAITGGQGGLGGLLQQLQGGRHEDIDHQAAWDGYHQASGQLSPDQMQTSAEQAFAQMSPEQRAQLAQILQDRARQQDLNTPGLQSPNLHEPGQLAAVAGDLHRQDPGLFGQLLGGGGGASGLLGNPVAKIAMGLLAAKAITSLQRR
jgi:hypothetical protein